MKCRECKKKLTLAQQQIICKCDNLICSKCKAKHKCLFDYKKEGYDKLTKKLIKIEIPKITKI